ncbi:WXG100 family type VII secretion target [Actinoallomurus acaciae]|uniref:WXG100 family type VII secretion target n=1 Tax=Actinoallomurus acaciae TaxID=502577 RepID=A0ABV5Y7C4_9ACTN
MAPNSDHNLGRPSTWPWGKSKDGEIEFDPSPIRTVINALKVDRARYDKGDGNLKDLQNRGDVTDAKAVGGGLDDKTGYPAGRILATYLKNAQGYIAPKNGSGSYANFLQSYDAVIKTLNDSVTNYNEAEDASLIDVGTGTGTAGQPANAGAGVTPTETSFQVADPACTSPTGHWAGELEDFRDLAKSVDPGAVRAASKAWLGAQSKLMDSWDVLYAQGSALSDAWKGKAGNAMQQSMKNLYFSSCALADATGQVGVAVESHAGDLDELVKQAGAIKQTARNDWQHFKDGFLGNNWGMGPFLIGDRKTDSEKHYNAALKKARDWMNATGEHAHDGLARSTTDYVLPELPTKVEFTLPHPSGGSSDPYYTDDPTGLNDQGVNGAAFNDGLHYPGTNGPSGTDLSGVNGDDPLDGNGTGTGNANGTGTDLAGTDGSRLPNGLGGTGTGFPGGGLPYVASDGGKGVTPNSGLGNALNTPDAAEAAALRNAAARGMSGMPMPMGAAGGRDKDRERQRSTYIVEDESTFAPDDDVAPPLIG